MHHRFNQLRKITILCLAIFSAKNAIGQANKTSTPSFEATVGTQIELDVSYCIESGLSSFDKKPKVYILDGTKKKKLKVLTKDYPSKSIACEWKKSYSQGIYPLYLQAKAKNEKFLPEKISDKFELKKPELEISGARIQDIKVGKRKTTLTIELELGGIYFGSKNIKVEFEYTDEKGKTKKKKFKKSSQSFNSITAASHYLGKAKNIPENASGNLVITTKTGKSQYFLDTTSLCANDETRIWRESGSLNHTRDAHSATVLKSGKVLIVGGYDKVVLKSVELYDPKTKKWREVGSLNTARSHHTATLLSNGQVLVTGGNVDDGQLDTTELYNPESELWTPSTPLGTKRQDHTATLLKDGRVLVVGGVNGPTENPEYLADVEIFDPETEIWKKAESLKTARFYHNAIRLINNKVLVIGGEGPEGQVSSSETFDPKSGNWIITASLNQGRHNFTTNILCDGKVLASGGVMGTTNDKSYLSSTELYDPESDTWLTTGSLNESRGLHQSTILVSGMVLVIGGEYLEGYRDSVELFNPKTGEWSMVDHLSVERCRASASLLNDGKVLVTGGFYGTNVLNSSELF